MKKSELLNEIVLSNLDAISKSEIIKTINRTDLSETNFDDLSVLISDNTMSEKMIKELVIDYCINTKKLMQHKLDNDHNKYDDLLLYINRLSAVNIADATFKKEIMAMIIDSHMSKKLKDYQIDNIADIINKYGLSKRSVNEVEEILNMGLYSELGNALNEFLNALS